jgi:hypothetical protein
VKCPHCGRDCIIPDNVRMNVDTCDRSAITVTRCCGRGVVLSQIRRYVVEPYRGDATVDDWGHAIRQVPQPEGEQ